MTYVIMEPKRFVSPHSPIVPGKAYCHNEHVRMGKKNLLIHLQGNDFEISVRTVSVYQYFH